MYKVVVFNPLDKNTQVKNAMFEAGGGQIGDYDSCSFEQKGLGQFRPLAGSKPFIGQQDRVEIVEEIRLEMVCADDCVRAVIAAMKKAHPYEEVAYDVIKLEEL